MDNPVDFIEVASWKDFAKAQDTLSRLESLGFEVTSECCEIKSINLLGLGLLHKNGKNFAVVFEDPSGGVWCEIAVRTVRTRIGKDVWGKKLFVASNCGNQNEWSYDSKEIELIPGADPDVLFSRVDKMLGDIVAEKMERMMFAMDLHDRLYQKYSFLDKSRDPAKLQKDNNAREKKILGWVSDFVSFFRPLGFLGAGKNMPDRKLEKMIQKYESDLFSRFKGTHAVVDDFDSFEDFFSSKEIKMMPKSNPFMDMKILAILDPDRVWWAYRLWNYEQGYGEKITVIDGKQFLKSLSKISRGQFEPRFIKEKANERDGFELSFRLDDKSHRFQGNFKAYSQAEDEEGVLAPDLQLVSEINALLPDKQRRFEVFDYSNKGEDNCFRSVYIIMLSEEEREKLRADRKWKFK